MKVENGYIAIMVGEYVAMKKQCDENTIAYKSIVDDWRIEYYYGKDEIIERYVESDKEAMVKIEELDKEIERLKSRNLIHRILNK